VRGWRKIYDERGIAGIEQFDAGGSSSRLSTVQEEALKAYVAQVRIPAKPPTDSGINPPGDSGVMSPTDSGVISPGAPGPAGYRM
jgi:hypothetical protein